MKIQGMKFFFQLLLIQCCHFISSAQNPEVLNGYQSVFMPPLVYDNGKTDIYDIRKTVAEKLVSCRVPLFLKEDEISYEAMKNPCAMLHCLIGNSQASGTNMSMINILFLNCKSDTVLKCSARAEAHANLPETRNSFIQATRKALEVFNGYHYHSAVSPPSEPDLKSETGEDDSIAWKASRKLRWDDFKGKAVDDDPADALTYTANQTFFEGFGVGSRFNVESKVTCYFIKDKSWVKTGKESDYLLNHEQRHFDLAETGAREFRKKLKQAIFNSENFNKEIKKITDEVHDKYDRLQEEYDAETNHSRIEEKQKEWDLKIDRMLGDLEEFR